MADTDPFEFILLDNDLTTRLSILPVIEGHLYFELNESGSGEAKIPLDTTAAGLIESGQFVAGYYRGAYRGGFFVENIAKFHADESEGGGRVLSISGRGALALLDDAVIWSDAANNSTREYDAKTKGYILKALIDEAQARGGLANLTYDFTAVLDSDSVPWTDSEYYKLNVGMSLLDLTQQFAKTEGIDFDLTYTGTGFLLSAYKGGKGTNKSSTQFFRTGTNCEEIHSDERGNAIKNALLLAYETGYVTSSDSTSITNRRRREELISIKAAQNTDSANTYGAAKLTQTKDPQLSISVRVYDGIPPYVFLDYDIGDTVALDITGTETDYRIYGLQLDFKGDEFSSVVVEFNSTLYDLDAQMSRDLDWLLDQWNTAHDADLLQITSWQSLGSPDGVNVTCSAVVGRVIYLGAAARLYSYNMDTREWAYIPQSETAICMTAIGTDLYIGDSGLTLNIRKYDTLTDTFSVLDTNGVYINGTDPAFVYALVADGTDLYIGGIFSNAGSGPVACNNLIKFNTLTDTFSSIGGTTPVTLAGSTVHALTHDGSSLYAFGAFTAMGGVAALNAAYYDGTWHAMDVGISAGDNVRVAEVYGASILVGSITDPFLQEWDGAAWADFGGDVNDDVRTIKVFLSDVYVGGFFTDADKGNRISRYSNGAWNPLTTGTDGGVVSIQLDGDDVYVFGSFTEAGGVPDTDVAAVYFNNFESFADFLSQSGFDLAAAIHNATAVTTPLDADEMPLWKATVRALRKVTWANIKATMKAYFDTLYFSLTQSANRMVITNAAGLVTTDADFGWDNADKQIKIGQPSLSLTGTYAFNIVGADGAALTNWMQSYGNTAVSGSRLAGVRGLGTKTVPLGVTDDVVSLRLLGYFYDDTNAFETANSVAIYLKAAGTHTATSRPTRIELWTTPAASITPVVALTISPDASATLVGALTLPASGLKMNAGTFDLTGGGTLALGGFTLTVPATGTAALLATAQTFTALNTFTPATSVGAISATKTLSDAAAGLSLINVDAKYNVTGNTAASYYGIKVVTGSSTSTHNQGTIAGMLINTNGWATGGTTNVLYGLLGTVVLQNNGGIHTTVQAMNFTIDNFGDQTTVEAVGASVLVRVRSTGGYTNAYGYKALISNISTTTAAIDNAYGFYSATPAASSGKTIGTAYGFRADNQGGTGITNAYGIYLSNQSGAATLNYAIYTNAGLNRLGDQLAIVGSADRTQLQVTGFTTQTLAPAYIIDNTAATNVVRNVLQLETQSTGTAAAGLGAGLLFSIETATASTMRTSALIASIITEAANATFKSKLQLSAYDTAQRIGIEILANGTTADINLLGDTWFVGAGLGLPYGSFYGNEIAFAVAVNNSYAIIADTDCVTGEVNLVTYTDAGTTLTISKAGKYKIDWAVSAEAGTANVHILGGIMIDSTTVLQAAGQNHTETTIANRQMAMSGTAIISCPNGTEVIGVGVGSDANITITVDHVNLSIVQVGG